MRLPVNVYELLSKINKVATRLNAQRDRKKPATYNEIGTCISLLAAVMCCMHSLYTFYTLAVVNQWQLCHGRH